MLRRLANPVHLVLLAVMFIMAGTGHHIAVAATMDGHARHVLQVHHDHGAKALQECGKGSCEPAAPSCCLMGQCMLAALPLAGVTLPSPTKPALGPAALFIVANAGPSLPFRPPA